VAIAFGAAIGTNTGPGSLATTNTLTTTGAVPSGALVVVHGYWYADGSGTVGTLAIVDNDQGYTWTTRALGPADELGRRIGIAYTIATSGLASGTVLTATFGPPGGGYNRYLSAAYFTGVDTSSPYDTESTIGNGSTDPWASGNITPTSGDRLLVGAAWQTSKTTTSTPATNYSESADFNNATTNASASSVYRILTADGSTAHTPGGTWASGGGEWVAGAWSFKADAGGGDTSGGGGMKRPGRHRGRFPGREPAWF
jgi:hypothetical protein